MGEGTTNIRQWHKDVLDMIQTGGPVALVSCFVDGEPTAAIAVMEHLEDGSWEVRPQFVGITPKMRLTDHDGVAPADRSDIETAGEGRDKADPM